MFCLLVVMIKLSVLAKKARKTPLRKQGDRLHKAQAEKCLWFAWFIVLFHCLIVYRCFAPRPYVMYFILLWPVYAESAIKYQSTRPATRMLLCADCRCRGQAAAATPQPVVSVWCQLPASQVSASGPAQVCGHSWGGENDVCSYWFFFISISIYFIHKYNNIWHSNNTWTLGI